MDWENVTVTYEQNDLALIRAAKDRLRNGLQVDNLTNIIDTSKTLKLASEFLTSMKDLVVFIKSPGKAIRKMSVQSFKSLLKRDKGLSISNAFLGYTYGVAPLVKDMQVMSKAAKTLRVDFAKACKSAGQVRSFHARCGGSFHYSPPTGVDIVGLPPTSSGGVEWRVVPSSQPTKIATVRGRSNVKYNTALFAALDYACSRFLSAGPASAIWELVPYSFVVDWFVDLSSVIDGMDNALTGSSKTIDDVCVSEAWDIRSYSVYRPTIYGAPYFSEEITNIAGQVAGFSELSYYRRTPGSDHISVGTSGRFGKKQAVIATALLHQIVANLK